MVQQLALTGDLGRVYPSEEPKISGFAKDIKGGNTKKLKPHEEQGKRKQKEKG